jgi:HSP20 family molecular chaperone IbpA
MIENNTQGETQEPELRLHESRDIYQIDLASFAGLVYLTAHIQFENQTVQIHGEWGKPVDLSETSRPESIEERWKVIELPGPMDARQAFAVLKRDMLRLHIPRSESNQAGRFELFIYFEEENISQPGEDMVLEDVQESGEVVVEAKLEPVDIDIVEIQGDMEGLDLIDADACEEQPGDIGIDNLI